MINGVIPKVFGNLENLDTLNLFMNNFSGEIPASIAQLPLLTVLRLHTNKLNGTLPPELGKNSPNLYHIEAHNNELTGAIPEGLCTGGQLESFTARHNHLNSSIPAGLASCPTLQTLSLENNQLSGNLPQALANPTLTSLNLSSNELSGQVPAGLDKAVYVNSLLDNPGLCTAGSLTGVSSCGSGSQDAGGESSGGVSSRKLHTGLLIAALVLVLVTAVFVFFVVRHIKKPRRRVAEQDGWKITLFVKDLGFGEATILRALTEENPIGRGGSGSVYRVSYTSQLNGSNGAVAVKQIQAAGKLSKKLEREFASELGILGNLRHENIVRLLCCLSGAESRLVVYEYMDNGSLDKWLHGDGTARARRAALDWPTRLGVAVGAAQGLCSMHHECLPPVVRRNVKANNILLDSEFKAKVADFGLAKMLAQAGTLETRSAIAGSFGYMAPECAHTAKVDEKVDVYSFGVVLLELTTGKEANDSGEHGTLAKWAQHHYRSGGSILDATDQSIKDAGYSDDIEVVFRQGVFCTAEEPSSRPTMNEVLQILVMIGFRITSSRTSSWVQHD
ncbi:unnamed protein product [Urochloa humidicola]